MEASTKTVIFTPLYAGILDATALQNAIYAALADPTIPGLKLTPGNYMVSCSMLHMHHQGVPEVCDAVLDMYRSSLQSLSQLGIQCSTIVATNGCDAVSGVEN